MSLLIINVNCLYQIMSKETTIVFLYDLNNYKSEIDNGSSPVLYFHPQNVSHIQKNLLCGHICATADTFHGFLGPTKIIALENGKFVLRKFGNFHLGVGSDINLPNWMLERRIEMLSNWIQLYHNDFETIEKKSTSRNNFLDRLRVIFESFIKFLPNRFAMFENSLHFLLPKSTSLIFLEAVQLLQFFKTFPLVVGGTILFENRIIATQFEPNLIRSFIQSDPYRVPTSAERVIESNDYQLLVIYVNKSSYETLRKCSDKSLEIRSVSKEKVINSIDKILIRNRSSIFSTVIEEDSDRVTEKKPARRPQTLNLMTRTTDIDYDANMKGLKITTPFARDGVTNTPTTTAAVEVAKTKTIYDSSVVICEQKNQRSIDFDDMEIETSLAGCNVVEPSPNCTKKWFSCNDLRREICSFPQINRRCYTINDIKLTMSLTPVHFDIETAVKDAAVSQNSDTSKMKSTDSDDSSDTPLSPLMDSLIDYSCTDKPTSALNQKPTIKLTPKMETLPNIGLSGLHKAYLFIYGLKDLALYLILECENDVNPLCTNFLDSLVRNCRGEFSNFESALRHYLELFDVQQNCSKDDYNFISIDSKWGPTKKINSLSNDNLDENRSLGLINQSFFNNNDLSEITLGTENGVAYGHRLANTTTLYWQQSNFRTTATGIPKPTDLFGTINTAAKNRLYNDHSINLL